MTYFCLLCLNAVTGVSYRAITHSTELWPSVVTVHSLDARRNIPPHSENNSAMKHKATFCDQLKHNTKKRTKERCRDL